MARSSGAALATKFATPLLIGGALLATAGFGGLEEAPDDAPQDLPVLEPGEVSHGSQFDVSLGRAVLIDELEGAGTFVEEGERTLAVTVTFTNVTNEPIASDLYLDETIQVAALPADRIHGGGPTEPSIARLDDATVRPVLQPGIPVETVVTWPIPADLLAEGDTLRVTIGDVPWYELQFLDSEGGYWDTEEAGPIAVADLAVEDVGAGADDTGEEDAG
ncbi:hypothetical protein [Microbacterium stercoris]|uniref:Uncharacterized protein n=1 Tax=Microbacterium stercoris TaxID=2820289 RepID=A0A939QGQ8_9MICO|nr:hypothetical protein [Microbacterium stercoris]MBO3662617.1 hypothetical protein [Microbacterium stercoris]